MVVVIFVSNNLVPAGGSDGDSSDTCGDGSYNSDRVSAVVLTAVAVVLLDTSAVVLPAVPVVLTVLTGSPPVTVSPAVLAVTAALMGAMPCPGAVSARRLRPGLQSLVDARRPAGGRRPDFGPQHRKALTGPRKSPARRL